MGCSRVTEETPDKRRVSTIALMPRPPRQKLVRHDLRDIIEGHFREQAETLRKNNEDLSNKMQRVLSGMERLIGEMEGVRTGRKDDAFARIGPCDSSPDLPTIGGEAALYYTFTAKDIGEKLGFHASQIGTLLGPRGLKWAGNGDYQEIGRSTRPGVPKFWHREVPERLRKVLSENKPEKYGIISKSALSMFAEWGRRQAAQEMLDALATGDVAH